MSEQRTRFDLRPEDVPPAWFNLMADLEFFGAAIQFAKTQGIIPAPEPAHAILFNLCGHGHFDMQAYDFLNGRLPEVEFDPADEEAALATLPDVPIQVWARSASPVSRPRS